MKVSALFPLISAALATPAADRYARQSAPPPSQITILSAMTSGNGCPQGTVSTTLSPDATVVTFGFDSFQTYIGPGTAPADHTKNCQIHLSLQYPGGFQLSLMQATYHGYAQLDSGVTGNFISSYYFSQNASNTASTRATFTGPEFKDGEIYTKTDTVENASIVWSPCGTTGILNVNNRVALTSTSSSASGSMSDDDATVQFTQEVLVQWRTCTGN